MIAQGALPPDLFTALAALFLLFGVPLILFGLIMLYTGYVQYDGERYVEELEAQADLDGESADGSNEFDDGSTEPADEDESRAS
ncbi:hypothetical protein HALLA_14265 [Halostagnicola larsenii XH-48]|uniref:Uncharacterized protein n=1 Tax=Halostagnicola larsenii XH-48 TaxID=797299 RepID=W0JR96_9EURY|nr:hypothetical protein [Halostagnicola larsenii]AHF99776.1 hypothetical protein HALLA_14265 [Halostagnicola larsenii XH-48]